MIDVSCILVNYNTAHYSKACIQSIIDNTSDGLKFEIVIVDNASKNEDYKDLEKFITELDHKNVHLIRSKQNSGFGGGNMLGVQHASMCRYYAFINNDTLQVSDNCLYYLKSFMEEHSDAAVCSPQMLDENNNFRVTIDHFSSIQREILRRPILEKLFPKKYLNRKIRYTKPQIVDYVQGSFMFVDAEYFNLIGGFDTNLFLYYEESDVCRRLLKGYKKNTYLLPHLEYVHYKGASTNKKSIHIKIEQKISLLYYIRKHFGWFHYRILLTYYCFRYFFTSIVKPKYWKLFFVLIKGAPLSSSLKQGQQILEN